MITIAIIGATGLVGTELLSLIFERNFKHDKLILFASENKKILLENKSYEVFELNNETFKKIKGNRVVVFFCSTSDISKKYIPECEKKGFYSIDNSSAFRLDPKYPLIVPEVNSHCIKPLTICNPNCSTIILTTALSNIHNNCEIKKIIVSTYQAISGGGKKALEQLYIQTKEKLEHNKIKTFTPINKQIAFNVFSHESDVSISGYNEEEIKLIFETKKILDPSIHIEPTCIRVPVERAHTESIYMTFSPKININEFYKLLKYTNGVEIVNDNSNNNFPEPIKTSGKDLIQIGRIREIKNDNLNLSIYSFIISGDQIRKGAALNAIQIAEKIFN